MNKNIKTILTTAMLALATGCVTAGTWVNGYYVDGPLCTVCDGTRVVQHTYGTTVCQHCDGTGIEPPEEKVVYVNNVVYDTWRPAPPRHHHRPAIHHNPPRHGGGGHHEARPAPKTGGGHGGAVRANPAPKAKPAARQAVRPAGGGNVRPAGGGHHGGGHRR